MRKYFFSILNSIGIPAILKILRIKNKEVTVLMFHRISDETDLLWNPIPVKKFELLIKKLKHNTCIIPLEEIFNLKKYPGKPLVALSFDDGYRDFYENALSILTKYGMPAHHNICPGLIDKKMLPWTQILNLYLQYNPVAEIELPNNHTFKIQGKINENIFLQLCNQLYTVPADKLNEWIKEVAAKIPKEKINVLMDWRMIEECSKSGIHIGSHSLTHQNLSKLTNENELIKEIEESKIKIQSKTGIDPQIFAFPNGLYNDQSMQMVKDAGYKIILLCNDVVSKFNNYLKEGSYVFPRISISQPQWKEEYLRSLGFHQKLKKFLKNKDTFEIQEDIGIAGNL